MSKKQVIKIKFISSIGAAFRTFSYKKLSVILWYFISLAIERCLFEFICVWISHIAVSNLCRFIHLVTTVLHFNFYSKYDHPIAFVKGDHDLCVPLWVLLRLFAYTICLRTSSDMSFILKCLSTFCAKNYYEF